MLATATVMSTGGGVAAWAGAGGGVPASAVNLTEQRAVTDLPAQAQVRMAHRAAEVAGVVQRALHTPFAEQQDATPSAQVVDSVQSAPSPQSVQSPMTPTQQSPVSPQ